MSDEQRRFRVLAGMSRARLLSHLRRTRRALGVRELADAVGLHPNTVRGHLDQMVETGLIDRVRAEPSGRGRPAFRYAASPGAQQDDASAYRALAAVLATELAGRVNAVGAAVGAGELWGRQLATGRPAAAAPSEGVASLVDLLDQVGFAPENATQPNEPLRLRRCPFGTLARDHGDVVCGVHLGLMRGALRELGAPLDAVRLEPFVEPDLCLAHLSPAHE